MTKKLITIIFLFLSFQVLASSIEQQLIKCSQITKASMRLSCFDTITSAINVTALNVNKALNEQVVNRPMTAKPEIVAPVVTQPAPAKQQDIFGFEAKVAQRSPEKIVATISSLRKNPYGHYIISLKNGQVWQQKDSGLFRLAENDIIFIKKGALGSFLLGKEGKNKKIRVKRVK